MARRPQRQRPRLDRCAMCNDPCRHGGKYCSTECRQAHDRIVRDLQAEEQRSAARRPPGWWKDGGPDGGV